MTRERHITIDQDGAVTASPKVARWLGRRSGQWQTVPSPPNTIILQKDGGEGFEGEGAWVRFAGVIAAFGDLADIISMISASGWEGSLHVSMEDVRITLLIRKAAIVGAASTDTAFRLGELLCARGVITREQLDEALSAAGKPRYLGGVLIERGLITPHQLYSFLRIQVEEIFYSALSVTSGSYYFYQRTLSDPEWQQMQISIENLMLTGLQRIDEMQMFRSKIPDADIVFERVCTSVDASLDVVEKMLFEQIDGELALGDITRLAKVNEYDATRSAYRLLQAGVIRPRPNRLARRLDQTTARFGPSGAIELANAVLSEIYREARRIGCQAELERAPLTFSASSEPQAIIFDGLTITSDGTLAPGDIMSNVAKIEPAQRSTILRKGLQEFLAFALFWVMEKMGPEEGSRFRRRVESIVDGWAR